MKKTALLIMLLVLIAGMIGGCGRKRAQLNAGKPENIAILSLDGNLPNQTGDQIAELDRVLGWMDKDLIKNLNHAGFNAVLIRSRKDYNQAMGSLLIINVEDFNAGNRALRAFVGFGAGAASLNLDYQLLNRNGDVLKNWKDGVGSSKGGTYCAQTLNRRTQATLANHFNR